MLFLSFILQFHTMSAPELIEESDEAEILVSTAQNNTPGGVQALTAPS